jgi:Zn ribbon nucleic-acid-binding protein
MNMKKTKPKKLLTVLLTLYLALSIVPITAYAGVTDVTGGTTTNTYSHFYHTKVETTAQVTIKDADGNVIETTEVTKSGDFVEGNVSSDAVQAEIKRIDDEINAQYSSRGSITIENRNGNMVFDHFESSNIITSGDNILVGDQDALENAASGSSVNKNLVVHEYQVYQTTYDLIVQAIDGGSQDEATINNAYIENVKFAYRSGDAPQATAEVYNADADKYEIDYECWQEFENNEPVAAWYSDNGSHGSLPKITEFESGKKYVYSLMLKPKDGYSFNSETTVTVNGESVKSSLSGEYLYVPAVKTITPTKQNTVITSAAVENVKLDYKDGEAPRTTATAAAADRDKYDILYECWGKLEKTDEYTTKSVAYWYSDEDYCPSGYADLTSFDKDGKYEYSVRLEAKDGYIFSDSISADDITLNGKSLPEGSFAMTLDDNRTCVVTYGMNMRPGQAVAKIDFIARTNFNAGDKPSFMTSAVDPFIDLDHERWDANDGSGYGITSSDYWNERYNGKLITEFEAGKSYTYGVYFKISDLGMEEGYRFDKNTKLYINGEEITLTPDQINVDDNGETIWFMNVLTMMPTTVKVIDVVEINDATVSFKDGDKPVFTGKSPEGVKYAYNCEWWELDSKTGAISADFFSGAYENKITAFEAGKTYHYGVYVKAVGYVESENTTYVFGPNTKLKINGEFVNYKRYEGDASDGSDGTMWVLTDLTMTPAADGHTHKYGTEWKYDETNHWHECECGNKADITAHNFKWIVDRKATTTEKGSKHEECTVCGYKKAAVDIPKIDSHNHNYGTEWKYDKTNHWHECEDGEKADITAHNFKWIIDKEATATEKGSKHEECTVCGYKKTAVDIPVTDFGNSSDDQPNKPINTASSESSSADQTNKPINTASPKTGNTDNMILWIVLLVIGGGAFITATAVDRKKK